MGLQVAATHQNSKKDWKRMDTKLFAHYYKTYFWFRETEVYMGYKDRNMSSSFFYYDKIYIP